MMCDVSVIIPCYQAEATVQRCLESVMKQRRLPLEIILINDGSTDGTQHQLLQLQSLWQAKCEIKVIRHDQNKGVAAARNTGWSHARGRLIAFLDADDIWHTEKLKLQTEWMRLHPEVDVTCHAVSTKMTLNTSDLVSRHVSKNALLFKNYVLTSSVMLKREITLRFNASQRHSEDYRLWLELAFNGFNIYYLEATLTKRFKAAYGAGGLSESLCEMQRSELANYRELFKQEHISLLLYASACIFSTIKFIKRLFIHFYRAYRNKAKTT